MKREKIEGRYIYLRPFRIDDAEALYAYLSLPEVAEFEPYEPLDWQQSLAETVARAADAAYWAICLRKNEALIGNLYFAERDFGTYELGYVLHPNYQRQGYGYDATSTLLREAFFYEIIRRIIVRCDIRNKASWSLAEKLGMRKEGIFYKECYFKRDYVGEPIWIDSLQYALLREEWEAQNEAKEMDDSFYQSV